MFADDTNLIISDKIVHALLTKTNLELQKMIQWFKANELSPCLSTTVKTAWDNAEKMKFSELFHGWGQGVVSP